MCCQLGLGSTGLHDTSSISNRERIRWIQDARLNDVDVEFGQELTARAPAMEVRMNDPQRMQTAAVPSPPHGRCQANCANGDDGRFWPAA